MFSHLFGQDTRSMLETKWIFLDLLQLLNYWTLSVLPLTSYRYLSPDIYINDQIMTKSEVLRCEKSLLIASIDLLRFNVRKYHQ